MRGSVMFQTQERFAAHERLIWFVLSLQRVSGSSFLLEYFYNSTAAELFIGLFTLNRDPKLSGSAAEIY